MCAVLCKQFDNLYNKDNFFERQKPPKLTQKETNANDSIPKKEIELVVKVSLQRKFQV